MTNSASQWGSPNAPRRALLIHGLTMCSNSWETVARLLVAEGFFVIAPNLLGHAWRRSNTDYSVSTLAEDLRPYFVMDTSYDVIIGHSLGGVVALSLLPFLPPKKETTVILVDPVLEIPNEHLELHEAFFLKEAMNLRTPDEHMAENPAWSRNDCELRVLGLSMCNRIVIKAIFEDNKPWSFSGLFKNVTPNVKISVLLADPKFNAVCHLAHIPHDAKRLNTRLLMGTGHCIHFDCPSAIMDVIPLPRASL